MGFYLGNHFPYQLPRNWYCSVEVVGVWRRGILIDTGRFAPTPALNRRIYADIRKTADGYRDRPYQDRKLYQDWESEY